MKNQNLTTRTEQALGKEFVEELSSSIFCIVGCGAIGSLMAEMLVRTGATKFYLIDGDKVELSNLNRTSCFINSDCEKLKVSVLKERLKSINSSIDVKVCGEHIHYNIKMNSEQIPLISSADTVILTPDNNNIRRICERICRNAGVKNYLSAGVMTSKHGGCKYECTWKPETAESTDYDNIENGYGEGSYASICMEISAVAFQLLLSNIHPKGKKRGYVYRSFEGFDPIPTEQTGSHFKRHEQ